MNYIATDIEQQVRELHAEHSDWSIKRLAKVAGCARRTAKSIVDGHLPVSGRRRAIRDVPVYRGDDNPFRLVHPYECPGCKAAGVSIVTVYRPCVACAAREKRRKGYEN